MADEHKDSTKEPTIIKQGEFYDPILDPDSPDFDAEQYADFDKFAGQWIDEKTKEIISGFTLDAMAIFEGIKFDTGKLFKGVSVNFEGIADKFIGPELKKALADLAAAVMADIEDLKPYIAEELKKPEYNGMTVDDLLNLDATEQELYSKVLAAAREARDADRGKTTAKDQPERTTFKRAQAVEYPLDKPNSIIWHLLEKDTGGQIQYEFNLAKYGSKNYIPAVYSINFDELGDDVTITKRLLPFDKRVYIAVSALFNAGNNVITLSQIHYMMGNTRRPSAKQLEKINAAVSKMTGARIFFDNKQEAESYKYPRFKYDGSLLPLERKTAIINGQLADAAIHIFREPPLISFAKQRRQITTIDVKLLQSPVNKTDDNLVIDDYLLERISKAKNGKGKSCRILYKTIYDHTGIKDKPATAAERKAKQRAPEKIKKYLDYYRDCDFISRYTAEPDGVTIYWK